jgi:hypothetical protein
MKKLSTLEKARLAKEGLAKKQYETVEKACKSLKLSPASYYNYAKKLHREGIPLPKEPTTKDAWADEIAALKKENEYLRDKIKKDSQVISKLQNKVLQFVLEA